MFVVTREDQSALVEMAEQMLNRVDLGAVCGRCEAEKDLVFGDCDLAQRGEEVGEQLLRSRGLRMCGATTAASSD